MVGTQLEILHAQKLTKIKNVFACSKHSNLKNEQSLCFFKHLFFYHVHHSFQNLERILTLMIRKAKGLELMKIVFIANLNTFGSNMLLTLKIMVFKNVALTKVVHIYLIEGMNA